MWFLIAPVVGYVAGKWNSIFSDDKPVAGQPFPWLKAAAFAGIALALMWGYKKVKKA